MVVTATTATSVTLSCWRRRERGSRATCTAQSSAVLEHRALGDSGSLDYCSLLLPHWDDKFGGRCVRAAVSLDPGAYISAETPILRGRCITTGCPGCSDSPCTGRMNCRWAAVLATPRLANAVAWHAEVCAKLAQVPPESRVNHIRVCCLLAMVVQACASDELWQWLTEHLRAECHSPEHPIYRNTASFGKRFAAAIPPPPDEPPAAARTVAGTGAGFSAQHFSSELFGSAAPNPAAAPERLARWERELTNLLMLLQTNLFYIDETMIGIFPIACREPTPAPFARPAPPGEALPREPSLTFPPSLTIPPAPRARRARAPPPLSELQHSCRPNASVEGGPDSTLVIKALAHIGAGAPVAFCYLPNSDAVESSLAKAHPDLAIRRERLLSEAGFLCRCSVCEEQQARDGVPGCGAARAEAAPRLQ